MFKRSGAGSVPDGGRRLWPRGGGRWWTSGISGRAARLLATKRRGWRATLRPVRTRPAGRLLPAAPSSPAGRRRTASSCLRSSQAGRCEQLSGFELAAGFETSAWAALVRDSAGTRHAAGDCRVAPRATARCDRTEQRWSDPTGAVQPAASPAACRRCFGADSTTNGSANPSNPGL